MIARVGPVARRARALIAGPAQAARVGMEACHSWAVRVSRLFAAAHTGAAPRARRAMGLLYRALAGVATARCMGSASLTKRTGASRSEASPVTRQVTSK